VSQLVISDVSRSYAGQLSCYAHNEAGSTSDDFAVVVHCKRNFTSLDGEQILSKLRAREQSKICYGHGYATRRVFSDRLVWFVGQVNRNKTVY